MKDLKEFIREVPDFPKPGILFRDISPVLADPAARAEVIERLAIAAQAFGKADAVLGLDARGFIFGSLLASRLELPFVMCRKKGKLPGKVIGMGYDLEYGSANLEIQKDALRAGDRVLIVDDLLATGGSAMAAAKLVEQTGAEVAGCVFVIELSALDGRKILQKYPVQSLTPY